MGSSRREPRRDLFDSPNKQRCVSRTSATRCHPSFGSSREMRTGLGVGVPLAHPRPRLALTPTPSLPSRRRTSKIASVIDHSNRPTFSKLLQRATPAVGDVETSRVGTGAKSASPFGASATRPTRATRDDAPPTSEFTLGHLTLASDPGDPRGLPTPARARERRFRRRSRRRTAPRAPRRGRMGGGARLPPGDASAPLENTRGAAWERRLAARGGGASGRRGSRRRRLRRRRGGGVSPRRLLPRTRSRRRRRRRSRRRSRRRGGRHHRRSRPRARGARGGATKGGSRARVPLRRRRQARSAVASRRARHRATRG